MATDCRGDEGRTPRTALTSTPASPLARSPASRHPEVPQHAVADDVPERGAGWAVDDLADEECHVVVREVIALGVPDERLQQGAGQGVERTVVRFEHPRDTVRAELATIGSRRLDAE